MFHFIYYTEIVEVWSRGFSFFFINPFAAKFEYVVWEYFHIRYYTSFYKVYDRTNQKYL